MDGNKYFETIFDLDTNDLSEYGIDIGINFPRYRPIYHRRYWVNTKEGYKLLEPCNGVKHTVKYIINKYGDKSNANQKS